MGTVAGGRLSFW